MRTPQRRIDPGVAQQLLARPQRFEFRTTVFSATRGPIESDWTLHENSILPLQVTRLLNV